MEMNNQRMRIALASGAGLISPFFTWVKIWHDKPKSLISFFSGEGLFSYLPFLVIGCFLISLIISLTGDKFKPIKKYKVLRIIPSLVCIGIGIMLMSSFEASGDEPAVGLYLNLIAAALHILFTLVNFDNRDISRKDDNPVNNNSDQSTLGGNSSKQTLFSTITNYVVGILFLIGLIVLFNLDQFNFFSKSNEQNKKKSDDFSWFHNLEPYQQWVLGIGIGAFIIYSLYSDIKKFFTNKNDK